MSIVWNTSFAEQFNLEITSDNTYEVTGTKELLNANSIHIPDSHNGTEITSIGDGAFAGAKATEITIGSNVTHIGSNSFSGIRCESITIPLNVTTMEPLAFTNCNNLTIYCDANSKPAGWANNWHDGSVTVIWSTLIYAQSVIVDDSGKRLDERLEELDHECSIEVTDEIEEGNALPVTSRAIYDVFKFLEEI